MAPWVTGTKSEYLANFIEHGKIGTGRCVPRRAAAVRRREL
jgi:hypothetical protein